MSPKHTKAPKDPTPEIRRASDFKSIYVNWLQTTASPIDVQISIGEASQTEHGSPEVEQKARIIVSPVQAKILVMMLVNTIRGYEKQFGEIHFPEGITQQLGAAEAETSGKTEGD